MTTTYTRGGVTVKIGQSQVVELPPLIVRMRMTGMLFENDKTFLLPGAIAGMRGLVDYYEKHPDMSLVITGHTDRVGDAAYNVGLSDERADVVAHYLRDEVDPWLKCYQGNSHSQLWGVREDQFMLSEVKDAGGVPFYNGPIDGQLDATTQDAVRRFQIERGLAVDGQPGPETRRALCTDYMGLDGTTLPPSATLETLGCGENHNEVPTPDGVEEPANRRVEIFFFENGEVVPPCPPGCPGNGCAYEEWRRQAREIIDVDHDVCELIVECRKDDQAVEGAKVQLLQNGAVQREDVTAADGNVRFQNLVAGSYHLVAEKLDLPTQERDIEVHPASAKTADDTETKSFAQDGGGTAPGTFHNITIVDFSATDFIIQIVNELPKGGAPPGLFDHVREGVSVNGRDPWLDVAVTALFEQDAQSSRRVATQVDTTGKAAIPFDPSGKKRGSSLVDKGVLQEVTARTVHFDPLVYTIWDEEGTTKLAHPIEIKSGETKKVSVSSRLRLSVNSTWTSLQAKLNLATIGNHFDDLTILNVFVNGALTRDAEGLPSLPLKWDNTSAPPSAKKTSTPERQKFFGDIVTACHQGGSQVLIGFAHAANPGEKKEATPEAEQFRLFMVAAAAERSKGDIDGENRMDRCIRKFAEQIDQFVFGGSGIVPDSDGISFDIEWVPPATMMPAKDQAAFFRIFYRAVAACMVLRRKLVVVATGEFLASNTTTERSLDQLEAAFNGPDAGLPFRTSHPYDIALDPGGKPIANLVLRPMAFGQLANALSGPAINTWYSEIIKYALDRVGIDASQLQMILQLGTTPGMLKSDSAELTTLFREVLRPHKIGFAPFAHGNEEWNLYSVVDKKLNPDEAKVGTLGQPIQVPLNKALP